jgi:hypothetical protein
MPSQKSKSSIIKEGAVSAANASQPVSELKGFEVSNNGLTGDQSESGNADDSFSISRDEMIPIGMNGIGKCSWSNRVVVVCTPSRWATCGFAGPLYGFADPLCGFADLAS